MAFDVCVCFGPKDAGLGDELSKALADAGLTTTLPGHGAATDPSRLGVPETDFGGAAMGVLLVTRQWTAAGGLSSVLELAERIGTRLLLAWWDEDAPSDFSGSRRPDESIFYACFLPRDERIPALVERLQADLAD